MAQILEFRSGMDPHSLELDANGRFIGFANWHPEREPRLVIMADGITEITLDNLKRIVTALEARKR